MTPPGRRPIVMLVTSRARLAGRVGIRPDDLDAVTPVLLSQIEVSAAAGVNLIQLREPDLDGRALMRLARAAVHAVRGTSARLVVNNRPDVALAAGLDGVHLPEGGLPAARVRTLLPAPAIVGVSVHGAASGLHEAVVDYAVFGTVYRTASKSSGHAVAGIEGLRRAVAANGVPVLAIGGVTLERLAEIAASGAAGFAAIELFLPTHDRPSLGDLRKIVEFAHEAFDTVKDVS